MQPSAASLPRSRCMLAASRARARRGSSEAPDAVLLSWRSTAGWPRRREEQHLSRVTGAGEEQPVGREAAVAVAASNARIAASSLNTGETGSGSCSLDALERRLFAHGAGRSSAAAACCCDAGVARRAVGHAVAAALPCCIAVPLGAALPIDQLPLGALKAPSRPADLPRTPAAAKAAAGGAVLLPCAGGARRCCAPAAGWQGISREIYAAGYTGGPGTGCRRQAVLQGRTCEVELAEFEVGHGSWADAGCRRGERMPGSELDCRVWGVVHSTCLLHGVVFRSAAQLFQHIQESTATRHARRSGPAGVPAGGGGCRRRRLAPPPGLPPPAKRLGRAEAALRGAEHGMRGGSAP